jgi:hypothetical protein
VPGGRLCRSWASARAEALLIRIPRRPAGGKGVERSVYRVQASEPLAEILDLRLVRGLCLPQRNDRATEKRRFRGNFVRRCRKNQHSFAGLGTGKPSIPSKSKQFRLQAGGGDTVRADSVRAPAAAGGEPGSRGARTCVRAPLCVDHLRRRAVVHCRWRPPSMHRPLRREHVHLPVDVQCRIDDVVVRVCHARMAAVACSDRQVSLWRQGMAR